MGILDTDRRILVVGIARMMDGIGNSFLILVLPLYLASGDVTGGTFGFAPALITGIILSAYGFFNSGLQPFAGNLSDRVGKRRVFVVGGLLILTVSNFTYSLVHSYGAILLVRLGQGIGAGVAIPATLALVNELATDAGRGEAMGVYNSFRMVGIGAGPIAAGAVVNGGPYDLLGMTVTGFESAFYLATAGAIVAVLLMIFFVSDPDLPSEQEADAQEDLSIAILDREGDHVFDPVFTLGLASVTMPLGVMLMSPLEPQINTALGQGATLFGIEFALFTAGLVFLQTPIGWWSDEYGRRRFVLGGLLVFAPATLATGFVTTPLGMGIVRIIQGIAGAGQSPTSLRWSPSCRTSRRRCHSRP